MRPWFGETARSMCIAIGSLVVAGVGQLAPATRPATAEEDVRAFIREADAALESHNRQALERMLGEGFALLHSTGNLETRSSFLDRAAAGALMSQRVQAESLEDAIRIYDGRTAVRTTRTTARVPRPDREPREFNVRTIDVYVKIAGRWLWVSEASTPLPVRPTAVAVSPGTLSDYVGQYTIDSKRSLVVSTDGTTLRATASGRQPAELIPQARTEFTWFNPDLNVQARLTFLVDGTGRVTGAVFHQEGEELWRATRVK